ncbi:hypothetical protein Mapa_016115 [Marchantia paleacea]|nr:hypothetical protein Mapa_016115 [Marchantia paleacea]
MDSAEQVHGVVGAKACEMQTGSWVEDVDSDILQEQTQAVCEELQKRGACTTLALARYLGFEKSSAINPLMFLLSEKNVVVRVSDLPPIWSLSPTFPMSPLFGSNKVSLRPQPPSPVLVSRGSTPLQCTPVSRAPVPAPISVPASVTSVPTPTPGTTPMPARIATTPDPSQVSTPEFVVSRTALTFLEHVIPFLEEGSGEEVVEAVERTSPKTPLPENVLKPAFTFKEKLLPEKIEEKEIRVCTNHLPAKTTMPALTFKEHIIPTPPCPVVEGSKNNRNRSPRQTQTHGSALETGQTYRRTQRQFENERRGPNASHKKRKSEEYLTELQMRILCVLKEMGAMKTLQLSKKLGLVTCRDVNPSLYDLLHKNLVVKIDDAPVVWQLYESGLYKPIP